eukprot:6190253-Pleurochrysis_carterae.AAC.3
MAEAGAPPFEHKLLLLEAAAKLKAPSATALNALKLRISSTEGNVAAMLEGSAQRDHLLFNNVSELIGEEIAALRGQRLKEETFALSESTKIVCVVHTTHTGALIREMSERGSKLVSETISALSHAVNRQRFEHDRLREKLATLIDSALEPLNQLQSFHGQLEQMTERSHSCEEQLRISLHTAASQVDGAARHVAASLDDMRSAAAAARSFCRQREEAHVAALATPRRHLVEATHSLEALADGVDPEVSFHTQRLTREAHRLEVAVSTNRAARCKHALAFAQHALLAVEHCLSSLEAEYSHALQSLRWREERIGRSRQLAETVDSMQFRLRVSPA